MTSRVVTGIGPSDVGSAAANLGISAESYREHICSAAQTLAQWRVTLAVNGDSESTCVLANAFLEASDNPVRWYLQQAMETPVVSARSETVVVPPKDIAVSLVRAAHVVLCIGFGTGTALEVCLAKFESRAHVLVLRELVSNRLPKECTFERLSYISATDLDAALSSVLGRTHGQQSLTRGSFRRQ
jgi:hypothetical protein